ncbi:type VI secretion system tip protein TssI/VgrG [Marinobacter sp.]|uniref:type VI secretion system Vgr family protein n=1 Tax=Marinobacter sp. TaxID=50741 RepID=UPI0019C46AC4|nr:type VI secretion system tip protein TssI/VgrG [Marinobacter sp.]MBD3655388.1 type VI secretion system tip protein VgrG [Marinobacter sp.]
MPQANGLQFTAVVGGLSHDLFSVVGFELFEGLSCLFHGRLELASPDSGVGAADVLEQSVVLTVWQDGQPLRRFQGVVSGFAVLGTGHHRTRYEVVMEPPMWRLGLMHNSRIFQSLSPDQIIRTLLEERGIVDVGFDLRRPAAEREYCVQYRESDLAFVERLAAEEGWHYRPGYESDGPALVFADHHGNGATLPDVLLNPAAGASHGQPRVFRFSQTHRVRPASVVLKDYTFRNPAYALMHERQSDGDRANGQRPDYQHFDYPGRFKRDASGEVFTAARLEAMRNDANTAEGAGNRPDFAPGARLTLTSVAGEEVASAWLLTHVRHIGTQPQALEEEGGEGMTAYHNEFAAVPAGDGWRPRLSRKRRPVMDGPQVAVVIGPPGEEIHCDEYGSVMVRFPWDRRLGAAGTTSAMNEDLGSAWLRVSQDWAGGQYGLLALPRVGHEVIVSFLDGDPDQPLITGRTYHGVNRPPYPLPEHKTRTVLKTSTHKGEGSNELRFEDEGGQEQIFIHAQNDLDLLTEHNRTEVIRGDSHCTVANHQFSHVHGAEHRTTNGEHRMAIGADCSQVIAGSYHQKNATTTASEAGTEIHHKAGAKVVLDAGVELTIAGGGSFIKLDPSGVTLSGPGIRINSGGSAGSGRRQSALVAGLPQGVEEVKSGSSMTVGLANVGQREAAQPDEAKWSPLPDAERKLIVDVIGGDVERQAVTIVDGSIAEGSA